MHIWWTRGLIWICSVSLKYFHANFGSEQEVLLPLNTPPQIWFTNNCACFIHGYFMVTSATHMGLKAIKTLADKHRKKKKSTADTLTTSLIFYSEALLSVDGGVRWNSALTAKKTKRKAVRRNPLCSLNAWKLLRVCANQTKPWSITICLCAMQILNWLNRRRYWSWSRWWCCWPNTVCILALKLEAVHSNC